MTVSIKRILVTENQNNTPGFALYLIFLDFLGGGQKVPDISGSLSSPFVNKLRLLRLSVT